MISTWPHVNDEFATIAALAQGASIARFGDGEAALMHGGAQVREPASRALALELRQVIRHPHPRCLIGIPTLDPAGPKFENWYKRHGRFYRHLFADRAYYSAFISRPDSAPWIRNWRYAASVQALWRGKRRAVVCEPGVAFHRLMKEGPGKMVHIPCPHRETYAHLNQIEADIVRARPDVALLSCGPAATCLANRVARHGIQALDLGSMGTFMLHELSGPVTDLRVFALGPQRTGTTSLGAALSKAGFQVAHNRPKWIKASLHTAVSLTQAHARGDDPVADMPGVGAIVHPSVCVLRPEPVNLWPQMDLDLLAAIRRHHPDCVFVFNTRPVEHWIASISHWKDFRRRLTDADVPGLPPGTGAQDEDLRRWLGWHRRRCRELFCDDPLYVEINIEDAQQCESRLSRVLGRAITWRWLNTGPHRTASMSATAASLPETSE